jgi:hypothetical protein
MSRSTGVATWKQASAGAAAATIAIVASSASAHRCPRCHRTVDVAISAKHPVCRRCADAIARQARAEQEHAYLASWLSSRADAAGDPVDNSALTAHAYQRRSIRRAVAVARVAGHDWRHPPEPMRYDKRLTALLAPWRHAAA